MECIWSRCERWRGIQMMSAALSVLAGVEQTGKSAGSPDPFIDLSVDPGKPEGMSFAKSFSDRIGQPGLLQEKSSAKEASIGVPPGPKTAILAKKLNAGVATSGEENEVNHSVQKIAAQGKAKSTSTFLGRVTQ